MARRKKDSGLGRNEILFSGRKLQVPIPTTDLHVLEDHDDQMLVKAQVRWGSFGVVFIPYNAIIDPRIDCLALVNKPIAFKAYKYGSVDITPLPAWKNGVMVMPRLKVDGRERENVPMLIADLGAKCDMIFGRQWLEEFGIPLDCNKESVVQKDQKNISIPSRGSSLDIDVANEKAVSVIVTPSCSYHENCKIQGASDVATLPCQEEDPYRSRIPTAHSDMFLRVPVVRLPDQRRNDLQPHRPGSSSSPFGIPNAPVTASKDRMITDEDVSIIRPVIRLPGYRHDEKDSDGEDIDSEDTSFYALPSLETSEHYRSQKIRTDDVMLSPEDPSFCQEKLSNELSNEPNNETCQPHVRLPRVTSFRPHRIDEDNFFVGTSQSPMITSKDRIAVSEDIIVVELVVRLPERQDLLRSLSPPLSSKTDQTNENTEETDGRCLYSCLFFVDPVEETCLAETAWNEEIGELNDHRDESHGSRISIDNGIDYEDRNSNSISDNKQNRPKNVTRKESQILDLNIPSIELIDIPGDAPDGETNDFDHGSQLDVQTGIVDNPYSLDLSLFAERAFTWGDTGWYSQFLRIQYSAWAPRFLRTTFSEVQGLFWRILLLKLFVSFMYQSAAWFDTGWPFICLFRGYHRSF